MSPPIEIVAAVVRDGAGRFLLVRKQGTQVFMQPGGKREPGEDDLAALARELDEELGVAIAVGSVRGLGRFRARAANESGREVVAAVYAVAVIGVPAPRAEIAEILWFDPRNPPAVVLAPLTRDHILRCAERISAVDPASERCASFVSR